MSAVEQLNPLKGQDAEMQDTVAPAEGNMDTHKEQPSDDSTTAIEEDPLQVLVDADDEQCRIEEATVLNAKEAKTKEVTIEPPVIPKRNTLRASRLLNSLKLNSIESATKSLNTTHTVYLSSEEDASSSADDFSDYDYESSSEESEKSHVRRKSQEITARAVSVVFVGKPCVIDLSGRKSVSPARRPQSEFFGRSVSSSSFETDSLRSRPLHPPRKSSLVSISDLPKGSPSFLDHDPFSTTSYDGHESASMNEPTLSSVPYPRTPLTPTAAFQRIQKSISLVRKRSRPNLKAAVASNTSMINLPTLSTLTTQESIKKPDMASSAPTTTPQSPVTYNAILRVARRNSIVASTAVQSSPAQSQPASPITPITAKRLLSGLNMNRRRSTRIKT
ncbi:hypothetical protein F5Y19DRAFT_269104 [Xylariaceae sp. FL1651]|nr:hypothetical protein F5Y19DRAFT_269104 [Xylariaceae sp. FL1651]